MRVWDELQFVRKSSSSLSAAGVYPFARDALWGALWEVPFEREKLES